MTKNIIIKLDNKEILTDIHVFHNYIRIMKNNIFELIKNLKDSNYKNLEKYLENANNSTKNFINNNVSDSIVSDYKTKLLYEYNRDTYNIQSENDIKLNMFNLINDMDIILATNSIKGKIDLTYIDILILELYKENCKPDYKHSDSNPNSINVNDNDTPISNCNNYLSKDKYMIYKNNIKNNIKNNTQNNTQNDTQNDTQISHASNMEFNTNILSSNKNNIKLIPKKECYHEKNNMVDYNSKSSLL